ncbi:hypothetical protein SEPCBS119000_001531 [Sporothrix epigloea]|uniref:25S rRNA (Uridine(2843)-N(3))-methyltransferase n=1 Tax=Sporothrix epigloea TaxID=1892477 RepID=A0ABP0DB93_9PEZI
MPKLRGTQSAGSAKNSRLAAHKPPNLKGPKPQAIGGANNKARVAGADSSLSLDQQKILPHNLQQDLLGVFARALAPALASPRLNEALQAVKHALYERDFSAAFGTVNDKAQVSTASVTGGEEGEHVAVESDHAIPPLDAYAARWSPTRALCYASILASPVVQKHWKAVPPSLEDQLQQDTTPLRMVAIGGGAAELVAFGALLTSGEPGCDRRGDLVLVDSGPWGSVVDRLRTSMVDSGGRGRKPALVEAERFGVSVRQRDILAVADEDMGELLGRVDGTCRTVTLVSLFFTLNELFTAGGLGAAATFLLRLTAASPPGTVLLVVDSPGSYAEMAVGSQARKYPMRWLLDKFLLQDAEGWNKVHEDEAIWFRLSPSLSYPIRLEDMRYQVHLYVRI